VTAFAVHRSHGDVGVVKCDVVHQQGRSGCNGQSLDEVYEVLLLAVVVQYLEVYEAAFGDG
jgi:hypothetical protein